MTRGTIVALVLAGLALVTGVAGGSTLEPQVWGWEQHFTLDWTAVERGSRIVLQGYLASTSASGLRGIRLLVESLDAAGAVQAQRVVWVPGDVTPFSRVPFVAPAPGRAPQYRVRVFTFDRIETNSWQ
jgi:hypothetical protein